MQISPDRKRRQDALRQRLLPFRRDWLVADLGRLAFSIAEKRGTKNWKNDRSAVQSLIRFLNGQYLSVWTELATENLVLQLEAEADTVRRENRRPPRREIPDVLLVTDRESELDDVLAETKAEIEEYGAVPDLENNHSEKLSELFIKVAIRLEELGL
jgi:hypothetical protein